MTAVTRKMTKKEAQAKLEEVFCRLMDQGKERGHHLLIKTAIPAGKNRPDVWLVRGFLRASCSDQWKGVAPKGLDKDDGWRIYEIDLQRGSYFVYKAEAFDLY